MKPRAFAYFAPETLYETLDLLAQHGSEAKVLAGGQSLVPLMNMREVSPAVLVDINPLVGLSHLRQDGYILTLGAMLRQRLLATSPVVSVVCPPLTETASLVGFPAVRSRGTLGGSLAHAEPGAQLPMLMVLLGAELTLARREGRRTIAASDFFKGAYTTALAPDELLLQIHIPAHAPVAGFAIHEYRRGYGGPPLLAAAALLDLDDARRIASVRLSLAGADEVPLRLDAECVSLVGTAPTGDVFHTVAERAAARVRLGDAVHADIALRQRITAALVTRTLNEAYARAWRETREGN
ncbi:MAG TPA: FAD binding domain-containing protein [Ktedonobacterales bacterium]|jgi:carbon-monoxide dehydrogenase medium subunit|nr:FAD binding domain-containing protein [Ktedonobacterales bacterium]